MVLFRFHYIPSLEKCFAISRNRNDVFLVAVFFILIVVYRNEYAVTDREQLGVQNTTTSHSNSSSPSKSGKQLKSCENTTDSCSDVRYSAYLMP
jgi:hypothetical protein